jgi:uncharacterized protein YehS (DUF1456 family)
VNNNDILRRVRYTFNFADEKMIDVFRQAGHRITREQISDWLKKDDDPAYKNCGDTQLAAFLNGLINEKRGKREESPVKPEKRLNNNIILRKLKIALSLRDQDVLNILALADLLMSKHELSALFRKPDHKNYRNCKDQILRNFLRGLQIKFRTESQQKIKFKWK